MRRCAGIIAALAGLLLSFQFMYGDPPATVPAAPAAVPAAPAAAPEAPAPAGGAKPARPTTPIGAKDCTNGGCHAAVKNYKAVHGPVNVNACDACHKSADASRHTFTLAREKKDLCTFCHKVETNNMPVVHKPLATGDCLPCHNPHGGKTAKLIRGNTMAELCTQCHKDPAANKKMVHGPVAAGACEACHMPHASPNAKLLVSTGNTLCMSCHKEMGDQLKTVKVVHKPVAEGQCSGCHDPHASDYVMQTKAPTAQLCTSCHEHEKIKQAATNAKYKHGVVLQDKACLNCHTAHGGSLARLMKNEPIKVCMSCHDKKIEVDKDHTVAAVSEVLDPKQSKHGPVRENNCSGCHNVHGSDVARLLSKPYPAAFYQGFAPEKYELCFSCHDKQLVLTPTAEGLTGFRNGAQNLHFVHVNKADKGRNCRVCHETHASKQPVHLRESVPFGKWELPINYTKAADGGSCLPGCHQKMGYDRKNPLNNHPTAATQPATPAAASQPAPVTPAAPAGPTPADTAATQPR